MTVRLKIELVKQDEGYNIFTAQGTISLVNYILLVRCSQEDIGLKEDLHAHRSNYAKITCIKRQKM